MAERRGKRSRTESLLSSQLEVKKVKREDDRLDLPEASESLDDPPLTETNDESNASDSEEEDIRPPARPKRRAEIRNYYESNSDEEDDDSGEGMTLQEAMKILKIPGKTLTLETARGLLKITDQDVDRFFSDLHLPLCRENPPAGHGSKRFSASTMTQNLMKLLGWRFIDRERLTQPQGKSLYTASMFYVSVSAERSKIPWGDAPISPISVNALGVLLQQQDEAGDGEPKVSKASSPADLNPKIEGDAISDDDVESDDEIVKKKGKGPPQTGKVHKGENDKKGSKSNENPRKPHDSIRRASYFALSRILDKGLHSKFPSEWQEEGVSFDEVRPEMPSDFAEVLHPPEYRTPTRGESPCSSVEPTPVKPLDTILEVDDTEQDPALGFNPFPLLDEPPTEAIVSRKRLFEREKTPSREVRSGKGYILAEALIEEHDLKLNRQGARFLEAQLLPKQREYDIRASKATLCWRLASGAGGNPKEEGFTYIPRAEIASLDQEHLGGNAARTENASDITKTAMAVNERWAAFKPITRNSNEMTIVRDLSPLFKGLFAFDGLEETTSLPVNFPNHLHAFSTIPEPDFGVRAGADVWAHWPASLHPLVISGDNKPRKALSKGNEAQLACNTHPTLIIDILMYLDTRPEANAQLPAWMWHYAWINTNDGFTIYMHYPGVRTLKDGEWMWRMNSVLLTRKFNDVWIKDTRRRRLQAKAIIDMMVSHTSWVHNQLLSWSKVGGRYHQGGIMNQLIARAKSEEGDTEWVIQEAKKALIAQAKEAVEATNHEILVLATD